MHGIPISLNVDIHRLKSKLHDSSHAATEWHRPHAPARRGRIPVGGENGLRGQVPAFFHVVVDEVLQEHLVDVPTAARTGHRPDVVDQYTHHETSGHGQSDDVGSEGKLALSQVLAGRSRQLKDRTYAPNHFVWLARREQTGQQVDHRIHNTQT